MCQLPGVGHTRLDTMLCDGPLANLTLEDILHTRKQRWITIGEAATLLGVNRSMVGQLVDAGRLRVIRPTARARRWFRAC